MIKYPNGFLKSLTPDVRTFIESEEQSCKENNITIHLSDSKSVSISDGPTQGNGCFEELAGGEGGILSCAVGKPFDEWFPTFVHESCHKDQFIEQVPCWTDCIFGAYESMDFIDLWTRNLIELNKQQKNKYFKTSALVELDCEKRAVAKMRQWDMPFDVDEYIQKANAYVLFYQVMRLTRKWYEIGKEPYNIYEVWSEMPNYFLDDIAYIDTLNFELLGIIADGTLEGSNWEETLKILKKVEE